MKNIFTTILFFSGFLLTAQNWAPRGAAWHYTVSYGQTAGYQYWHNDGDTTINGVGCHIIHGAQYLTTTGVADTAITQLGPVYTYSSGDTAYLFDTAFYPAFYFNAHAGDTINTRNMGSSGLALVDSNSTLVFNGDTLRYYIFHLLGACADSPATPFEVIEHIGSTGTSFVPAWNCADTSRYNYSLCNYSDSLFAVYPDSNANCTSLTITLPLVYHHLLDTANIWHSTGNGCAVALPHGNNGRSISCFGNGGPPQQCWTGSDTVVDSVHYSIVYTGDVNYSCLAGFIREDTLRGKVFFKDNPGDPEWLLYDFSMRVGDSVDLLFQDGIPSTYSGFWHLNNISIVNTPGGARRAYYLTHDWQSLTWLEGVGSPVFPVYLYYPPVTACGFFVGCNQPYGLIGNDDRVSVLTCYSHSSLLYFDSCAYESVLNLPGYYNCGRTITDSCDYGAICGAVEDIAELSSFTLLPNPATTQVNVQLDVKQADKFSIVLSDLQGKEVTPVQNLGLLNGGSHSAVIDLQNLSPGFYLVECRTDAGSLYSKLVVQK